MPSAESDEYVQLINSSGFAIDLVGWRFQGTGDGSLAFVFPAHLVQSGGRVRVYTNEVHQEWGGFSFGRGNSEWNSKEPDIAGLFNSAGQLVSEKSYPPG